MDKLSVSAKRLSCEGVTPVREKRVHMLHYVMVVLCIIGGVFVSGCKSDTQENKTSEIRLNLSVPETYDREVLVNGGVAVPVERIQWEWGDGRMDRHHFFPASHIYTKPGLYQITVTVFTRDGRSDTKSVDVEIK